MTVKIPIRGERGSDPGPAMVIRPRGEALAALAPFSAMSRSGSHISPEIEAKLSELTPELATGVRKVASED